MCLQGVPPEPTHIRRGLLQKLQYSTAFQKADTTVRRGNLKVDRKQTPELIVKDDLALLEELTEEVIMDNLVSRYSMDKIYTYIGEILFAINPYK